MPKPPLNERIKALEEANVLLIDKIERMKAQVRHNDEIIRKYKKREDKQEIDALIRQVREERLRKKKDKEQRRIRKAAKYRDGIDKRIEDCLRMNGKIT